MRGSLLSFLAPGLLFLPLALAGQNAGSKQTEADEKTLTAAKIKTNGPALLEFLKSRTLTQDDRERIDVLIAQLGSSSFKAREQATQGLISKGPVVVELLRQTLHHPDPEVHRRAEFCLQKIKENDLNPEVPAAVIRLVGQRKPIGAVAALLGYLPFADNDDVADSLRGVLAQLALQDGKADKTMVAALADKEAARRAAAGEALVRAGAFEPHKKAIRALLSDKNEVVRFRVANALVLAKDKDAVPVLIDVLPAVSNVQAWEIEESLYRLANGQSPPASPPTTEEGARKKCQAAWQTWWKEHAAAVDMSVLANPKHLLGFTTIILLDEGRIVELYPNDTIRWQIEGLKLPLDLQVLDKGRVLIAEYEGNCVTERNFKGDILWQFSVQGPQTAQRLPNGHTFIGGRFVLQEIDAKGHQVFEYNAAGNGIMKSLKLPSGDVLCLFEEGRVVRLNAAGKQVSSFRTDFGNPLFGGRLYLSPAGNVLIPHYNQNKVVEYDGTGKLVWQVNVEQPIAATRLPNGNTLVTSMSQNRAVEFDSTGKEVWQHRQNTKLTRALRR